MELDVFTPDHYRQILQSRAAMPRAARKFGLTAEQVKTIQNTAPGFRAVWDIIYEGRTLQVRLNEMMDGEDKHSPQAGETGPLRSVASWGEKVQLSVAWPGGSHLQALYPSDDITLLAA